MLFEPVGYDGCIFNDFFAARSHVGPGWYVLGRNSTKYGTNTAGKGTYIKLVARPDVPPRKRKAYNTRVRAGWHYKGSAQAVADMLNRLPLNLLLS